MNNHPLKIIKKFILFFKEQGFYTWIWLVYLLYPLFYLLIMPLEKSWIGFILLILFLVSYLLCYLNDIYIKIHLFAIMVNVMLFCVIYDPNFYFMIFFTTFMISNVDSQSLRWVHIFAGVTVLIFAIVVYLYWGIFQEGKLLHLFIPFILTIAMPYGMWTNHKSRKLKQQLHSANDEIERLIKNQERERIARDLHDTLGHTLSLITLKSELAGKLLLKNPDQAAIEIKEIQLTSRSALKQLRDLLAEMHSVSLEHEIAAAKQILKAANIGFQYAGDSEALDAVPLVRNMLALCLRESVHNVVKHSQATTCKILLVENASEIRIDVMDDGVGLGELSNEEDRSSQSGRGIIGIQERLNLIEGKLHLGRLPEGGTLLSMIVPRIVKGIAVRGNEE
jgi:two-component system, NarL family, sensor histidine kinase DesK